MIENIELASHISQVLRETFDALGESILRVNLKATETEAALYREKVGDIFYVIVFGMLEPLYEMHPELKPAGWDNHPAVAVGPLDQTSS